jgi:hypothetical protein
MLWAARQGITATAAARELAVLLRSSRAAEVAAGRNEDMVFWVVGCDEGNW